MIVNDIIKYIEKTYPSYSQMSFDNSGANIVSKNDSINGILVCLDANIEAIKYAIKNDINFIISHHPIIFNSIKNINDDTLSKKIKLIIKNSINCYSCHTNFDVNIKNGMGTAVVEKVFSKSNVKSVKPLSVEIINGKKYGAGNIVTLKNKSTINKVVEEIKKKLDLNNEKISYYYNDINKNIFRIAIMPGSGSGDIDKVIELKPDLYITSDLKHDQILDLLDNDISYVNATHYGLEKIFIECMYKYLSKKYKNKILKYYSKAL